MSGDLYINAEWLMDEAQERYEMHDEVIEALQTLIQEAPKEELKPILRSFWIPDRPGKGKKTRYICDHCGNYEYQNKSYCSKCGALMVPREQLSEEEGGFLHGEN